MIIIRKPRKRGWLRRMCTNLELAKEYFKMASLVKENAFEENFYAKEGMDRLKTAAKVGGFFSVRDMQLWIEQQGQKLERS
nr:MAG TPA: hypothetical protein [Caudoviricetes sp.]